MYLTNLLVLLPSFAVVINADCGCHLNRDGQCGTSDDGQPVHKYSKESNTPSDNNPVETPTAFSTTNMVRIKGGAFEMGTNEPHFPTDLEGPARNVTVASFYLDKYEVSNRDFSQFVRGTGYKTEAEEFGDSFIFEMSIPRDEREQYEDFRAVQAPWWIKMKGVTWERPEGPNSSIEGDTE